MLQLLHQKGFYQGKVRDVYELEGGFLVMVASDRISAFDHILPRPIPYKGAVLNGMAAFFLERTRNIVPNWLLDTPFPHVSVGYRCQPIRLEIVVRGHLCGHAWRLYQQGQRRICGVALPEGMRAHDPFPEPIITPAIKSLDGHDSDISRAEILEQNIVEESLYHEMESAALALFDFGARHARSRGLILADTKYEFGLKDGRLMLIDEIHTPDSSRYLILEGFEERQNAGLPQAQLSKEFVREWLMQQGFMGRPGDIMPAMPEDFVETVSRRYIELYEKITGLTFQKMPPPTEAVLERELNLLVQKLLDANR
ncbi:MAG: phosphoribosylaminoimidazolesuccinocarboxamide synthase [Flavobacteriales bacterium]|nr:phosphoribosylaminoimidazolesuccinocarboxamide synthase [Flavobacteriales bacterium]MCX7649062.1 phosphoribosylaminoimidazolesuccinocarboxamide synthase [Flavobacteriales bacterium]MDW8432235.1 phosphoribosylaminoimidazolesuccinocarboxamide synthase [Flavobacteriales bacterium]